MKKQNWYVNQRKYHFIYKTTCKVNDKYYLGMHSTDDLSDGYLGSGNLIAKSIKKHGRENFSIEILEFLPDRASLKLREAELVNEEKLTDGNQQKLQGLQLLEIVQRHERRIHCGSRNFQIIIGFYIKPVFISHRIELA